MAASLQIRPFKSTDRDDVIALWDATGLLRPWNPPVRDIELAAALPSSEIFVGEIEGKLVGTVMAGHDGHRGWIYYLAVAAAHASAGHGKALMRHAEAWLAGLGIPRMLLMIRPANDGVKEFYEALGYTEEKVVLMGRWLDKDPAHRPIEGARDDG